MVEAAQKRTWFKCRRNHLRCFSGCSLVAFGKPDVGGPCISSQPLCYLLLLPPVCFRLKEAFLFRLSHLPWLCHTFSLLSLNGVCTIWTFLLLVDRNCKYRDGFSCCFPRNFLLLARAWNRQSSRLWVTLLSVSPAPSFPPWFVCLTWDGFLSICVNITTFHKNSSK